MLLASSLSGVDDGHFQKVLDDEVRALQNACRALYMNHPLPKITFIIVKNDAERSTWFV
jgi:hypothetical protein